MLMCADENSDLTEVENWKFSNLLKFEDISPRYEAMSPGGAAGFAYLESRHYASLLAVGDDLLVLSRSGDINAKNNHDTNLITLHRIANFRNLS